MLVFVDGDDVLGTLHACQVLNGSADSAGNIEGWFDRLAGLTNLVAVGQPTRIDDGTSGTGGAAQRSSKFLNEMEILGFTQTATAAYNNAGVFERRSFAV